MALVDWSGRPNMVLRCVVGSKSALENDVVGSSGAVFRVLRMSTSIVGVLLGDCLVSILLVSARKMRLKKEVQYLG